MELTFQTYLHHTDDAGNSFLDLELVLLTTPTKRFRLSLTIPATAKTDFLAGLRNPQETRLLSGEIEAKLHP